MRDVEPFEVIVFRMPPKSAAMLTALAVRHKVPRSQLVRDMVQRMLPVEETPLPLAARRAASMPVAELVTAEEWFARGVEPNKVAAMLRMPYREVMEAYGAWADGLEKQAMEEIS